MSTPSILDCGHPDTQPDVTHTVHQPHCVDCCDCPVVCVACCPTCQPHPQEATG